MSSPYFFSLLLVVRNEEKYIANLLERMIHQDFDANAYEMIVVDGMSDDRTPEIIQDYVNRFPNRIKFYTNPKKTLPVGWNIAIKHSSGKYVLRVDGHSQVEPDFLKRYYSVIQKHPEATCVGGVIDTKGIGFWGEVNAYVYSHIFGVGNSKFRITTKEWEGYVDTVPYGAYKREIFDKVGLFNESLKRNEDIEMHARIRKAGGRFFLSTTIQSVYFARDSYKAFVKKSYDDGKWGMIASRDGKGTLRLRHLIPLVAFLFGVLLVVASFFFKPAFETLYTLAGIYFVLCVISSFPLIKIQGLSSFFAAILAFFSLHFSRGIGMTVGLCSPYFWRGKEHVSK
ncbi:glycosyltransferase family 2 protein [Fictibacillus gelatini]|uniref:glycosyltransferase family 2 protein n=1 Tax=Fictibacillus gelatini TaxID=225985 RepID=UPI00040F58D9|nr:glycosyltransferase family 2 protein [Fictibacillus gelatini]